MRREWTDEEDARLIAIANDTNHRMSTKEIAKMFERSEASVKHRATRLGCPTLGRQRVAAYSTEIKNKAVEMNRNGATVNEIVKETGLPYSVVIHTVNASGQTTNNPQNWTETEVEWLRENYAALGSVACGTYLNRSAKAVAKFALKRGIPKGKRRYPPRRIYDEAAIYKAYETTKNLKEVAAAFNTDYNRISTILKRNGVEVKPYSRFREFQEEIVTDYLRGDMSNVAIGKKYGLSNDRIAEGLKELGIFDPLRRNRFPHRKSMYECWMKRYGKEEADRRMAEYSAKKSLCSSGSNNPMYGKAPPEGAGNGWKGWYRGHYFRSLREVAFMLRCDDAQTSWESAERKEYTVRYVFMDKEKTYRPDFVVGNELIELKPKRLHTSRLVTTKKLAAEAFCAERGLTYRLIDIEIDAERIKKAMDEGLIKFDRDYEERFLAYVKASVSPLCP